MSITTINFTMKDLDGTVVPNTSFIITSGRLNTGEIPDVLPAAVTFITNANGQASVSLTVTEAPYYITKQDGTTDTFISYKFFVPFSATPLDAELLYVDLGKLSTGWNDKSVAALIEAKVVAVTARNQALQLARVLGTIDDIQSTFDKVNAVGENIVNVNTVGDSIASVNAVAPSIASVVTVAPHVANINIVAENIDEVAAVGAAVEQAVDGVKDLFIAGTHYTKDGTSNIGLSNTPAKTNTVKVFFDGIYQNKDTYYTVGNILYFGVVGTPALIPADTVEVQYEVASQFVGLTVEDQAVLTTAQNNALASAQDAEDFAVDAEAAQVAAEAARDAAQLSAGVYASTAAGIAATTSGEYFSIPSPESAEYLILYLNSAGTAVEQKRYPSINRLNSAYIKEQDTLVNQEYKERFEFFDLSTMVATNLTDGATPSWTKTKVAEGVQIVLSTGSRTIAFSTANKIGNNKTKIVYTGQITTGTTGQCGVEFNDGTNTTMLLFQGSNGWLTFTNTGGGGGILLQGAGPLTATLTVSMEFVIDADEKTASLFLRLNGGAPYSFFLANIAIGPVRLVMRNACTVIHSLDVSAVGLLAEEYIDFSAAPEITSLDRNTLSAAVGLLGTMRRLPPAAWAYSIPNEYRFYQTAGAYFAGIDLRPILSESDPAVSVLHVDIATGSDANAGTAAAPLKGLKEAGRRIGAGAKVIIKARGGLYPYNEAFGGSVGGAGSTVQVVSWDGVPVISSRHDTALTWTLDTDNTYSATFTNGISNVFDASSLTTEGDYTRVIAATTLAACKATAGTYYITGSTIYVHTFDNRAPDANIRVYKKALSGTVDNYGLQIRNDAQTCYLENVHFEGGVGPVNMYTSVGAYTQRMFAKNCTMKYAGGANGFNQTSDALIVMQNCIAAWNSQDGFNYKKSSFGGNAPLAIEIDCIGRWNGYDAEGTNNGTTMHSGGSVIRVNGNYPNNQNRCVHDVDNSFSWNMGCISGPSQAGNACYAAGSVGSATDTSKMWLDGCTAAGGGVDIQSGSTVGAIYTHDFTGTGTQTGPGLIAAYTP